MNVIKADKLGFCFGVKRAVDMALSTPSNHKKISTFGPLIHNDSVTQKLKEKNIDIIDDLDQQDEGTVIIRSHGVASKVYQEAQDKQLQIVDCTCPFVKKVHQIVKSTVTKGIKSSLLEMSIIQKLKALWVGAKM